MSRVAQQDNINAYVLDRVKELAESRHEESRPAIDKMLEIYAFLKEQNAPDEVILMVQTVYSLGKLVGSGIFAVDIKDVYNEYNVYGTGTQQTTLVN